jgi:N-acetyl-anhydromuramyl-L-alanine amidase AmpD
MKFSKKIIIFASIITAALLIYLVIAKGNIISSNKLLISGPEGTEELSNRETEKLRNEEIEAQENKETEQPSNQETEELSNKETEKQDNIASNKNIISSHLINWGYSVATSRKIDAIIIHSSYNALDGDPYDFEDLLKEYKQYGVSAHYVIDREGKIYRLVSEKNIAYHAGVSKVPDGRLDVNNFSIGIELMNKENSNFTSDQYVSLNNLLSDIKKRYKIKYVLGHNQIAPGRKSDPWNFEWSKL